MTTTVKLKNSVTTTNAPISLQQGEVAINITDKKVWVGNAATTPVQLLGDGSSFSVITVGAGTVLLPSITTVGDTNTGIFFPLADTIAFTEGGVESMRIDDNGNLGLGTISPTYKLDSSGTIGSGSTGNNGKYAFKRSSDGVEQAAVSVDGVSLIYNNGTGGHIWQQAGTERMRITSGGELTIGSTISYGGLLSVNREQTSSIADLLTLRDASAGTTFNFQTFGDPSFGTANRFNYDGSYLAFRRAETEQMRLTSAGDVGIGTSSPSYKLHSSGTIGTGVSGTNGSVAWRRSSDGTEIATISTDGTTFNYNSGIEHVFQTAGTERMRITGSGLLQFNSGYGSVATAYGCRAWVNFDGVTNNDQAGTYTQSGTTVVVTITGHGFTTGQVASLDFTSGAAVNGVYTVTVTDANVFTVVQASRVTTGIVTSKRKTIRASGNVSSVTDNGTGDYSVNFTTAMPDANYSAVMTPCRNISGETNMQAGVYGQTGYASSNVRLVTRVATNAALENAFAVSVSIFR